MLKIKNRPYINIGSRKKRSVEVGIKLDATIFYGPLKYNPILLLDILYAPQASTIIPLMTVRREEEGDEVDIYGWNPDDPRQYKTSPGGAYVTDEALLAPTQTMKVVNWNDQSGNAQDAEQTTAANQPELIWEGLTFGAEKVTNGDFADWTADDPDDWTITGESGIDPMVTEVAGTCRLYSSAAIIIMSQVLSGATDKIFELTATVVANPDGGIAVGSTLNGSDIVTYLSVGSKSTYYTALGDYLSIKRKTGLGDDITFDNVSVKEVLTWDYPVVQFDGIDDYFDLTRITHAASDYTFFHRIKSAGWSGNSDYLFDTETGRLITSFPFADGFIGYYDGVAWRTTAYSSVDFFNACFVLEATDKGKIYANIIELANSLSYDQIAIGGAVAIGSFYTGGSTRSFQGEMRSLIVYDKALTINEIGQLNVYYT